jgi:hypothetical protein
LLVQNHDPWGRQAVSARPECFPNSFLKLSGLKWALEMRYLAVSVQLPQFFLTGKSALGYDGDVPAFAPHPAEGLMT